MIGGGIYFAQKEPRSINTCIIEAMLRLDTQINPLTFSSMAGFIFTLYRPDGLLDANDNIFIRSDNISASGERKVKAGSGGAVVSTLVIKIVLKQNNLADTELDNLQLVLQGEPGYDPDDSGIEKSSLDPDEIITEQQNHNHLYRTFHQGEKLVPSLVGDLIEFGVADIQMMLDAIQQKAFIDPVKHTKVIRVFEYFASQITAHNTSVVMMFIEMVGEDTKSEEGNTYQVASSIENRSLKLSAARGACAIQLLTMLKAEREFIDGHEGNWFIDTKNPDNVRAIDFGRLVDITKMDMIIGKILEYKRKRQSIFGSKLSIPADRIFLYSLNEPKIKEYYVKFMKILEKNRTLPFKIQTETRSDSLRKEERINIRRHIHFCLVFAALIDNAITSLDYDDWDQAQMIWAYEAIWGLSIIHDKNKKYPLHHIPELDFEYDIFISGLKKSSHVEHVERSYDEIARLISLYIATPDGSAVRLPSDYVPGITATHMGDFVPFSPVAHCPPGNPGNGCITMGGSRSGRRYNKSTRRGRRYNKSNTRRGRKYSKSTRRGRHHHRRTYQQ